MQNYFLQGMVVCRYGSCFSLLHLQLHIWFCSVSCSEGSVFPNDCSLQLPDFMVCFSASICVICKLCHQPFLGLFRYRFAFEIVL